MRSNLRLILLAALLCACAHKRSLPRTVPLRGEEPRGAIHHVRGGETLWRIARTYDVPIESILREPEPQR